MTSNAGDTRRVVYVSYDGMEEPLGKAQVLPYLRALALRNHDFELISFEKPPCPRHFRTVVFPGIRWTALRYHKSPTVPATLFDMAQGMLTAALNGALARADLVHVRSYVAATLALPVAALTRRPLLFDMRGLWPDERVADGTWSEDSGVYRGAKQVEKQLAAHADVITVLTNSMRRYLREEAPFASRIRAPIHVIPTCADLTRFRPDVAPNAELARELAGFRVLGYTGSFGGRYLSKDMARFYLAWRKHVGPSRFLVCSRQEPVEMREVLAAAGVQNELVHRTFPYEEMPSALTCMDAGVFFHPVTFANRGAAPTKMGEMLGAGVPLAGNPIGDVAEILGGGTAGVVLNDFEDATLDAAARALAAISARPEARAAARSVAEAWFSLARAVDAYESIYLRLGQGSLRGQPDLAWPRE